MPTDLSLNTLTEFAPGNPREIDDASLAALKESLAAFGDISGIVLSAEHGLICGHQRVRALRERYGDGLRLVREDGGELTLLDPDGGRYAIREVDWDRATCIAANLAANSPHLQGDFTRQIAEIIPVVTDELPDLAEALRLPELRIPTKGHQEPTVGDSSSLPEALQLRPGRPYIVIVCADDDDGQVEFDRLREALGLRYVRRGGYKEGSPFDHVRLERVVSAERFLALLDKMETQHKARGDTGQQQTVVEPQQTAEEDTR